MDSTPIVRIVKQQSTGDCVIAVLAMYFCMDYEDVLGAAVLVNKAKRIHRVGMYDYQILETAKALKHPLIKRRTFDLETSCGILSLLHKRPQKDSHVVLLKNGLIFDTDATVWEPDIYFDNAKFKPVAIFEKDE